MRDGWVETSLDDIADVTMGQSPDGKSYNELGEGIPFMQGSAEFGDHYPIPEKWCSDPKKIAEPGDLLLSVRAPVGDTNFADQRIAVGRGLSVIRANEKSVTEYIRLVIQLNVSEMIASSGTGMFASITGSNLRKFKVLVPPISDQKRIVDLVNSVDSYIEALRQQLESSKRLRNAVLHDLLAASGDGWVHKTLGEVSELQMGRTPSRREPTYWTRDLDFPFCTIADMDSKFVDPKREGVTKLAIHDGKAKVAKGGTLLMSFKLTIGRMGFAARDIYPNEAIVMINANETEVLNDFLFLALGLMDLTEGSGRAVKGSTLNSGSIAAIALSIPPLTEQNRIIEILSLLDDMVNRARQALEQSSTLRSGLLSDLLSGEQEIPTSYDKFMGAA